MADSQQSGTNTAAIVAAFAAVVAVIALGIAVAAVAMSSDDDGGSAAVAAGGVPLQMDLSEFAIELSSASVPSAGRATVRNVGSTIHNANVRDHGLATPDLQAGESAELDLSSLEAGTYELYCSIPGHEEAGMVTTLSIGTGGATNGGHTGDEVDGARADQLMVDSIAAFPAETEGVGNQPLVPEILPDGTKRFELTTSIVDWEVEPGKIVQAWTYNGMVPGPRIDLEVGDRVEVEITNELPLGTDIHWHGIDVPNDQDGVAGLTQPVIASGESYTYRFTTTEPAIGMYHAHIHGQDAVPNGLFAPMYVGDLPLPLGQTVSGIQIPADLTLAQDIPMVLNDAGSIGLSLNGKAFPATAPIATTVGEWIRITYFNEGLQVHPMHMHGFEQIVVAKDGEALDYPYAADTILVGPGERYTVLVNTSAPGAWVWHCHILTHAESPDGLFGMVTAVIVS